MEELLNDFIHEIYYYQGNAPLSQVGRIKKIKDEKLKKVLIEDGLGVGTHVIVLAKTLPNAKQKYKKDKQALAKMAEMEERKLNTNIFENAEPFKEYEIYTIPDEIYKKLHLDEDNNVLMNDPYNAKLLAVVMSKKPKIISQEIARKILLDNVYPIPLELEKALVECLIKILEGYKSNEIPPEIMKDVFEWWKDVKERQYIVNQQNSGRGMGDD